MPCGLGETPEPRGKSWSCIMLTGTRAECCSGHLVPFGLLSPQEHALQSDGGPGSDPPPRDCCVPAERRGHVAPSTSFTWKSYILYS